MAKSTKRFLLGHRSDIEDISHPDTWSMFGGKTEEGESPQETVRREVAEEAGYRLRDKLIPLYVFHSPGFAYHNFITTIDDEFRPKLDNEHQGFQWCKFGDWPHPLHFGMHALLDDVASVATIRAVMADEPLPHHSVRRSQRDRVLSHS